MSPWIFLSLAICFEVLGTFLLKLSDGFEKWHWGSLSIFCFMACFWMFAPALKVLPVGIAYAIWAGVGIVAATSLGWMFFSEKLGLVQLGFIAMILVGSMGLRLTTVA